MHTHNRQRGFALHAADHGAWAKTLTDDQLTAALHELRDRGHAVACYGFPEFESMFDGDLDEEFDGDAFMEEHRDDLEEAMCETARDYFKSNAEGAFLDQGEGEEG
jgi:hypothetical protein